MNYNNVLLFMYYYDYEKPDLVILSYLLNIYYNNNDN